MELDYTPKYFRKCSDAYDVHSKNEENGFQRSQEKCEKEQREPRMKVWYFAVFIGFMCEFFLYYHRITMSVAIVAMVKSSTVTDEVELSPTKSCKNLIAPNHTGESLNKIEGEFSWSPEIQGYILGNSFLCYTIALPFVAKLTDIYGCKRILFFCIFFSSLFTFISPFAAKYSVYALMIVQILRGIAQSGTFPSEAVMIANWCPKQERGYSYTIAMSGSSIGAVVGSYLTGALCESTLLGGWSSAFFVNGGMGFLMSMIIYFFLYDNPSVHPKISPAELEYILSNQEKVLTEKRPKTPWKRLITSVPIYAMCFASFGQTWAVAYFLSVNPTFLKTILHFSVEQDGLFNALPFFLQIFTSQLAGILSTILIKRNYISIDKSRKFWTFLSSVGYSVCVLGIYFSDCNRSLTIILSLAALSFVGFSFAGCWIASIDMSPTFAGPITAIDSTFGSLSHFLLPVVVGYLTNNSQTIEQWHKIFIICIAVVLSSGVVFAVFGSAEVQPWNDVPEENSQEIKEKPNSK